MDHKTFRADSRSIRAIETATERGLADNESEATRLLINQGAADLGIVNGQGVQSDAERNRLKQVMEEASTMAAYIGVAWGLVLTLYPTSTVNWLVVAPMLLVLVIVVAEDMLFKYA